MSQREASVHPRWEAMTVVYGGRIIAGSYRITVGGRHTGGKKKVVVKSVVGSTKEAPLKGDLTPLYLAKMLLRELEREGRT
jgi:hypothetical protein